MYQINLNNHSFHSCVILDHLIFLNREKKIKNLSELTFLYIL